MNSLAVAAQSVLEKINDAEAALTDQYRDRLIVNPDLDRMLVSFQANKSETGYRWFKYKEGFSAALIRYICQRAGLRSGSVLDLFAGSGTALFAMSEMGMDATGIELLPSSLEIMDVRKRILSANPVTVAHELDRFRRAKSWERPGDSLQFNHLRITQGAFPADTESSLSRYLYETNREKDEIIRRSLSFAALCILESISFTRKDGQYLRWDARSGRRSGAKPFDKGYIPSFNEAIDSKLSEMSQDLSANEMNLFDFASEATGVIDLIAGSCLDILPNFASNQFNGIITSPPYCNRYDYTRTYALELAMLGVTEEGVRNLRQRMLSCTVENREKIGLRNQFEKERYAAAMEAFENQRSLSLILEYLETCRKEGTINNPGIPRMVRNYFAEMALVIFECARVIQAGSPFVMVNDNVRYQGVHIPVI